LTDLYVNTPEYKKVDTWMYALLVPEWLERFYSYSVFQNLCIPGECSAKLNIPAIKTGTIKTGPENTKFHFS
jgi:hypothetical protein